MNRTILSGRPVADAETGTSESGKAGTQQRSPPTEAAGEDPEKTEQEEQERRFSRFAGSGRRSAVDQGEEHLQGAPPEKQASA